MIDSNKFKTEQEMRDKLCNILVNCQELFEDLEDLQFDGAFKNSLKQTCGRFMELCKKQVDDVFNIVKDSEEKEQLLRIYDDSMKSRKEYRLLSFDERIALNKIMEDLRNGNVKYVGEQLYVRTGEESIEAT